MATYAFESVTVSSTAVPLTSATADHATRAYVTVEGGPVRFRTDGTAPTALIGHELRTGDTLELDDNDEIQKIQFIRRDGVDATLRVTYGV